ncbi:MAG: ATP-dependent zinc metalloprotease FtsH [Peptoniphilaceae bacterium]|nr:ATP-dependent zinc metalloprotease FtsH [Peptoniphilaceae bacterium]MDY5765850.1 ATP-dependent zinc metalloprotease FtsH [Peptoniphilaceae bacterium]
MLNNNQSDNGPKRPRSLIYYYISVFLILLVVQFFVSPILRRSTTKEVSYSEFVAMVNADKVTRVENKGNYYEFVAKDDAGKEGIYKTGPWEDEKLTQLLTEKGVKFGAKIPQTINPFLSLLISFAIPVAILWLMGRYLMKNLGGGMGNAISFGKSNAKVYVKAKNGKHFSDVAGQDEAKESLTEIVDFLKRPERYEQIGAVIPKGVLLVGPPGTGKTLLAKAVAGEADVPFFSISGSEFVELFVGMGASKVRDLFSEAKKKAPCIIFIDEIDAIGKRRDSSGFGGNDEREQTLNQLLAEMDGFEGNTGVVILAATNRPEILDPALTRPGRFDRQVRVELPDIRGREEILKVHAKDVRMERDVDLKQVARMTAGASGADLANIINEGALMAVRAGRNLVTTEDLIESVETVIAGMQKKHSVITDRDKRMIAYHEVGHALVAALQKHTAPVTKITIIPRTSGALGYTMQVDEEEKVIMTRDDLFKEIVTFTGGRTAEELIFHTKTTGASNDIERATKIARAMVTRYGMTDDFDFIALETSSNRYLGGDAELQAAPHTASDIDNKVREIISEAHQEATRILTTHEKQLHDIAEYLLKEETITGEKFMEVLNESLESEGRERIDFQPEEDASASQEAAQSGHGDRTDENAKSADEGGRPAADEGGKPTDEDKEAAEETGKPTDEGGKSLY